MDFNIVWYIIIGILLVGYAILDGFDLGVGILHLFVKGDRNRRILMNSIGPVWDGNEVWLITAGGALFAGFPHVYATSFSGFYVPFFGLLAALIFRAVSLEFRSKEPGRAWRNFWDFLFFFGSLLASFLFGLMIGNIIKGVPIGPDMEYQGGLAELFNPFALITGVFTVVMFAMQGSMYLIIKTEGDLLERIKRWAMRSWWVFLGFYVILTAEILIDNPDMIANFSFGMIESPWTKHEFIVEYPYIISSLTWLVVVLSVLAIANIPRTIYKGKPLQGFVSSSLVIAALISLFGLGIFPNLMISSLGPENNLDIYNSSSSEYTLRVMFIMALIGMPFVIGYTSIIYWTYRGKTELDESSY